MIIDRRNDFRYHVAGLLYDTIRYGVDKKHLNYIGTSPIDIRLLEIESLFRNRLHIPGNTIYSNLWYSYQFLKSIFRARSIAHSDQYPLFIGQPVELYNMSLSTMWRFTPGRSIADQHNYDDIESMWFDMFTDKEINKIRKNTDNYVEKYILSHPNYNQFYRNAVLLFNITQIDIQMFSLGDIRTYRFSEVRGEKVLSIPKYNSTFDTGCPTLDLWRGGEHG